MKIEILGTGCNKCKIVYEKVSKVIDEIGLDAQLSKIEDIVEIMEFNIIATPAIVVNGEVKLKGYVPSEKEIKEILMSIH